MKNIGKNTIAVPKSGCFIISNIGKRHIRRAVITPLRLVTLSLSPTYLASTSIKLILHSSEGCKLNSPRLNHLLAPRRTSPIKSTKIRSKILNPNIR